LRNVTPSAASLLGVVVGTKIGPSQAPPYGRLSLVTSQPSRPQHGASYLDVLVVQTRTDYGSSGTAVWWPRKMGQRPERLR
jgi:hypothetical protein